MLTARFTYSFVKHARLSVFIGTFGAINKSIAEDVVVNATIAPLAIRRWTCKSLHAVSGGWTFYWIEKQSLLMIFDDDINLWVLFCSPPSSNLPRTHESFRKCYQHWHVDCVVLAVCSFIFRVGMTRGAGIKLRKHNLKIKEKNVRGWLAISTFFCGLMAKEREKEREIGGRARGKEGKNTKESLWKI